MSNEIHTDFPSGSTIYAAIRQEGGKVWYIAGETFETWGTSGRTAGDYDIPLNDRGGSRYEGDFDPNVPAGRYTVQIFLQGGMNPSDGDTIMGSAMFQWTGTARVGEVTVIPTGGIGLAKDDVVTFVNDALHLNETNMNLQIQSVLDDLSQGPYLEATDEDQALTSGSEYLAAPTLYHSMISIILNNGSSNIAPLRPYPGGFWALKENLSYPDSVVLSNPRYYAEWGGFLWLYPLPGQSYTSRIDYYKRHAQDVENIEFSVEWKRALNFGVCFEMAVKRKMLHQLQIWGERYRLEKEKQRLAHPGPARIVGL